MKSRKVYTSGETFLNIIKKAREANAILIYDPNFRKTHSDEMKELKELML
jgi:hypothetical protein